MGAWNFSQIERGSDARAAFHAAREEALYDHGHAGYSGTIAEKDGFTVITHEPLTEDEAQRLANKLIQDGDPRVDDKWGPAGAIPVRLSTRTETIKGFSYTHKPGFDAYAENNETLKAVALEILRKQRKLRRGEKVESVSVISYEEPTRRPTYGGYYGGNYGMRTVARPVERTNVRAEVTIKKAPKGMAEGPAEAWLFFGWASS